MAGMQVSGLTGFKGADIVEQLMAAERRGNRGISAAKVKIDGLIGALQRLNSLTKTMGDAAKAMIPDTLTKTSAWQSTAATSTNKDVATATTTSGASAGSLTFTVKSVAQAGASISSAMYKSTDTLNGGAAFDLQLTKGAGSAVTVSVGANATIADVAAAINAKPETGVKATMVQTNPGEYRLQLESTTTGADTGIKITDSTSALGAGFADLRMGADTILRVGDDATGFDVTSPTATVKDVLPGVSVTALKADAKPVTIDVKQDVTAIGDKAKAFVDGVNEVLSNIRVNTKYDPDKKVAGALNGDSATRDLGYRLQALLTDGNAGKLAQVGVQFTKDGTLSFDKAKFEAAYAKDPKAVEAVFTETATKVSDLSKQATNATDGLLTVRINGEQAQAKEYTKQLQRFDQRMAEKERVLSRQFSALETLLSKIQQQGNWLQGQLASLPTSSK